MSRVSIFMSSYNYGRYLKSSIDSVLAQTFLDFELFILDDASTDNSWEIIQAQTDPRIRAMRNTENRNDKLEMNRIIAEMTSGEYIAVHHSDNLWEPDKLKRQVDFLDAHPGIGAVFTNALVIRDSGEPLRDETHFHYRIFDQPNRSRFEWLNYFFYHGNALCHPSVLIRRKCYQNCGYYRNGLMQIPDLDLWVRLCMKYEIHVLPEKLVRYRIQENENFTSGNRPDTRIRSAYEFLQVLEHYRAIPSWQDLQQIFPRAGEYSAEGANDTLFVLGRLAAETSENMVARLFGLNLVFEALIDPARARVIERLYHFTHKNFAELTARYDVFSSESIHALNACLAERDARLNVLEREMLEIKRSRTWKIALFLRRARQVFIPRHSQKNTPRPSAGAN